MQPQEITATEAMYIKLGRGGEWAHDCLLKSQTLRLSYKGVSHDDCAAGRWDEVQKQIEHSKETISSGTVNFHLNQIKAFYEKGETTLWIAFHADKLWWCFSPPDVTGLPDGTKVRQVKGCWVATDIRGEALVTERLNGKVTAVQGFKATIGKIGELNYLVNRINGQVPPLVAAAQDALVALHQKLESVIQGLYWRDFETLIDLVFQRAGWQRISRVGGPKKTLDINLLSPITDEYFAVQVKSKANYTDFMAFQDACVDMEYTRYYFAVHTPSKELTHEKETDTFQLWLPNDIARMAARYGLIEWIIDKAR